MRCILLASVSRSCSVRTLKMLHLRTLSDRQQKEAFQWHRDVEERGFSGVIVGELQKANLLFARRLLQLQQGMDAEKAFTDKFRKEFQARLLSSAFVFALCFCQASRRCRTRQGTTLPLFSICSSTTARIAARLLSALEKSCCNPWREPFHGHPREQA